jgi:hypothetical protein
MKKITAYTSCKMHVAANIENYMSHHSFLAFNFMFIGVPIFILLMVFAAVYLIALPLGLLMGWF